MARGEMAAAGGARPGLANGGRQPTIKLVLFGAIALCLAAILGFAISQETTSNAAVAPAARSALPTPRPALKPEEQAYVDALWPVHSQVERTALRVALGASFYKTKDLDKNELKARLDDAQATYRQADERIRALPAPGAFSGAHQSYLTAVQLFEESTAEMLKMYDDGNDDHLASGFPKSVQGADKIREVGSQFWPDEYPPN